MNNNNYQDQMVNYLNQYLANTAVLINKLYNYHWNIVGPNFFPLHTKLQEYYEKTSEIFDTVAERIKQLGGYPLTSLSKYSEVSAIKSVDSKNYTSIEVITSAANDFKYMHRTGMEINRYADSAGDSITSGIIEEYLTYLEKQLWMLEANLK